MYLCLIITIDCACSALLITVDNVNFVWTCVYLMQQWLTPDIGKYGFNIINVVWWCYIELQSATCYKCVP